MFSVKNWKQHCTRNSASQCKPNMTESNLLLEKFGLCHYQRTPTLDGFTRLLFWIFDYSFWLFDYSVWLFDYRVKYSKFLLVVERWFLLLKIIFVTPDKLFNLANNQMLISIIWLFRTNNSSNSEIFVSIILIIRPRLAFVGSSVLLILKIDHKERYLCNIWTKVKRFIAT